MAAPGTNRPNLASTCPCGASGMIFIRGVNYCVKCSELLLPEGRPVPLDINDPRTWYQPKPEGTK